MQFLNSLRFSCILIIVASIISIDIWCLRFCQILRLENMQEGAVIPPYVALAVRPNPGICEYVKVNAGDLEVEVTTTKEYLKLKEAVFDENWYVLEISRNLKENTFQIIVIHVVHLYNNFVQSAI